MSRSCKVGATAHARGGQGWRRNRSGDVCVRWLCHARVMVMSRSCRGGAAAHAGRGGGGPQRRRASGGDWQPLCAEDNSETATPPG
eukprot:534441-Pyramimonas_sp.AAC.1